MCYLLLPIFFVKQAFLVISLVFSLSRLIHSISLRHSSEQAWVAFLAWTRAHLGHAGEALLFRVKTSGLLQLAVLVLFLFGIFQI
jgi:hypothetical protein